MELTAKCPDCGAAQPAGRTCQDDFHQMLFWEAENPASGEDVHFLMVLCYHLQHPALYSPDGLMEAGRLLAGAITRRLTAREARRQNREAMQSGKRTFTIKGKPGQRGAHAHPVSWAVTAADVVAGGAERYADNVRQWAQSVYDALEESGNLATG